MPRFCPLALLLCFVPFAIAAEPSAVEKQIAIQHAMEAAEQYLKDNIPARGHSDPGRRGSSRKRMGTRHISHYSKGPIFPRWPQ